VSLKRMAVYLHTNYTTKKGELQVPLTISTF
jgi:hypothetical protein